MRSGELEVGALMPPLIRDAVDHEVTKDAVSHVDRLGPKIAGGRGFDRAEPKSDPRKFKDKLHGRYMGRCALKRGDAEAILAVEYGH